MLSSLSVLCRLYLGLVAFSLAGSLLTRLTGLSPGPIAPIAGALTIAAGFAALFQPAFKLHYRTLLAAIAASAAIELLGVTTAIPFGPYAYTSAWQPVITLGTHRFPLLLPIAWLLIVGASNAIANKPIQAALLAAMVDFVMEPVMTGPLGYWHWNPLGPLPGGASILNPFGWFITSYLVAQLLAKTKTADRQTAIAVLAGHLILTFGIGAIATLAR